MSWLLYEVNHSLAISPRLAWEKETPPFLTEEWGSPRRAARLRAAMSLTSSLLPEDELQDAIR